MDILITGARAPVAIEWARIAIHSGHTVWLADSFRWPIARFLRGIAGYIRLPPARDNHLAYAKAIRNTLAQNRISLLIPTCEEIFHIANARDQIHCSVQLLMPEKNLLFKLHNKFSVFEILQDLGEIYIPKTKLCFRLEDIDICNKTILKPVCSRFGQHIILNPISNNIRKIRINSQHPWVQQQKITGTPLCNYAIFDHGNVVAHQAYIPRYCINHSAATYFEPYADKRLENFITHFGYKTGYHGQIAFDFIEEEKKIYVIECNPRATSGIHILNQQISIDSAGQVRYSPRPAQQIYRIGFTLPLFFGAKALYRNEFSLLIEDYQKACDALHDPCVPLQRRAQLFSFIELLYQSAVLKRSLTEASTFDIEFNSPDA